MFTYRCPSCGKHHTVDKAFEQTYEANCFRCGTAISVTPELVHPSGVAVLPSRSLPAREESITQSSGDSALRVSAFDAPSLPEAEPRKNGLTVSKEPAKKVDTPRRKNLPQRVDKPEDVAPQPRRWTPPETSPPNERGPRPRWQKIAVIAAVGLVLLSSGGYLIFGGKKPEPKRQAKAPPKTTPKPAPLPAPKVEVKKKEDHPISKTPDVPQFVLSAPRLSAEVAANADSKYAGKFLEVSGLLAKIEQQEGLRPPARPHAVFATSSAPVSCDLQGSPTLLSVWNQLRSKQPFTIRGKYEKKGYLRDCSLMPQYTSTADSRYKDKIIEVSGRIATIDAPADSQQFPSVVFEGETNSVMEVRGLFRTIDGSELRKIQPGSQLTIQGKCSGLQAERSRAIRVDNCQLVYTSAPPNRIPRIDAARLLREYEEDLRPDYLPPPGEEERIETVWTIRQLVKDHSADPKAFVEKYRNRILRIQGKPQQRATGHKSVVILTSGDTDLTFQVECHFRPVELEAIRNRRESDYRICGLFTGKVDDKKLRLDNCQLDMPRVAGPELTVDYLPHKQGRSFVVDVAAFGTLVNRKIGDFVQREVHVQGKDEITEILVTHAGPLPGKSLFEEGVQEKWVQSTKARIRTPTTTGIYYRRLHAGFVEIGTPHLGLSGKTDITWLPLLKLKAQVGEKWKSESPAGLREFVLEKFDDFQGKPSAVIREFFTPVTDILHPIETLHVYAKGFGEVERRQWKQFDLRGGKRLLAEMKWVDDPKAGLGTKNDGKPASQPPTPPAASLNRKIGGSKNKE